MNKKYILIVINILVFSCRMPSDPEGVEVVRHIGPLNTYGECLDLDVNDSIIVAAANFNGFMIFDIYDSLGRLNPKQKYNGADLDPSVGNNQISKIRISESPELLVLMDKYDKIYINRLDGSPMYYLGGDVNIEDCYGAAWSDFTLDPKGSFLRMFNLVDHNMATEYAGEADQYSKTIIWQNLENFSHFPSSEEISSMDKACEYVVNEIDEAKHLHFSNDGLLSLGVGELGVKVYKQINQNQCYKKISSESVDNAFYIDVSSDGVVSAWPWSDRSIKANTDINSERVLMVLEMDAVPNELINIEFYSSDGNLIEMDYKNESSLDGDNQLRIEKNDNMFYVYFRTQSDIARFQFTIPNMNNVSLISDHYKNVEAFSASDDRSKCEDGAALGGYGGIYEPDGGLDLNPIIEFDVLGEVNSVYSQNHLILTGLSNSNGLLLTKINTDGDILYQKSIAEGYSVNDVYATDTLIGLAVGHDGVLIYSIEDGNSFILKGRLTSNYSNAIKIKNRNIYVGTENGIEIFVIN